MANPVAVMNTGSSHAGVMISASGIAWHTPQGPVCLRGDQHSCPIQGHGITPIVSGVTIHTIINGTPVAIQGSVAGCGAILDSAFATNNILFT